MTETGGGQGDWSGEGTICAYWASLNETNALNAVASKIPFGLGIFVYVPLYLIKVFNPNAIRYTLTNRRIRVDQGFGGKVVKSVALDDVADVRVVDELAFTRTGNVEIVGPDGDVLMTMSGIQDPRPVRQTILDAVHSRIEIEKVLDQQRRPEPAVADS